MHLNVTGFGFHALDDRRIIVSVSSFEAKKDGLLDSLPYMIVYLRDAVLSFIQEFEKAKSK